MASKTRSLGSATGRTLLSGDDPSPVQVLNTGGSASFLLIGDHAGNVIPGALGDLGVRDTDRVRHIAWDIGVAALGEALAARLDAVFIRQTYSRLVIDCNRAPGASDAIPAVSDGSAVPGNADLAEVARTARVDAIHTPYQHAIAERIEARATAGQETILVALHSFTPSMRGTARPWAIGILHDGGDARFALACLAALRARGDLVVGDNEPYRMDSIDYTIPRHAYPGALRYVEIEIRQDLLATDADIARWTDIVAEMLVEAASTGV